MLKATFEDIIEYILEMGIFLGKHSMLKEVDDNHNMQSMGFYNFEIKSSSKPLIVLPTPFKN